MRWWGMLIGGRRTKNGGQDKTVEFLLENKADVNAANHSGEVPLHLAFGNGHMEIIRLLMQARTHTCTRTHTHMHTPTCKHTPAHTPPCARTRETLAPRPEPREGVCVRGGRGRAYARGVGG